MKPHRIDPVSLISGLALLLVAGGYALSNSTSAHVRWLLVLPAALIVIGAGILASVAHRAVADTGGHATIEDDADPGSTD